MKNASDQNKSLQGIDAKTGVYPGMAASHRLEKAARRSRRGRILGREPGAHHCYHLVSRTCGGGVVFDEVEKEALALLIGKMSRFCGIEVLTYCVMADHFHVLARVPDKEAWLRQFEGAAGEAALLARLARFYSRSFMEALRAQLREDRRRGEEDAAQGRLQSFKERLCDVSVFMQELKLRYSKWYNRRHGRRGTLWMERFKSVLVEGTSGKGGVDALRVMALYIDLNPVRAGLVRDPAGYPWCGYASAIAGDKELRAGLTQVTGQRSWARAAKLYQTWLQEAGECAPQDDDATSPEQEPLTLAQLLRHRVRYFTDGVVVGSREFVRRHRQRDESDRRRVPAIAELRKEERLHCMRQLRVGAVTPARMQE